MTTITSVSAATEEKTFYQLRQMTASQQESNELLKQRQNEQEPNQTNTQCKTPHAVLTRKYGILREREMHSHTLKQHIANAYIYHQEVTFYTMIRNKHASLYVNVNPTNLKKFLATQRS